jgi:hypothetical protein
VRGAAIALSTRGATMVHRLRNGVTMEERVDAEHDPSWWERHGYKVTIFGFLMLMFIVLPLFISGR